MALTWGAAPPSHFDWREWDGDIVVFVAATGDTHELGPEGSTLLGAMLGHPGAWHRAEVWLSMTTTEVDGSPATDFTDGELRAFEHLLASLQRIGVVSQPAP